MDGGIQVQCQTVVRIPGSRSKNQRPNRAPGHRHGHPKRTPRVRARNSSASRPVRGRAPSEARLQLSLGGGQAPARPRARARARPRTPPRRRPRRASPGALLPSRREQDRRSAESPPPRAACPRGRSGARRVPDPRVRMPPPRPTNPQMNPFTSPISRTAMRPSRSSERARWTSPSISVVTPRFKNARAMRS
jgi:hypothetical protein